jgi:hypothetical protein
MIIDPLDPTTLSFCLDFVLARHFVPGSFLLLHSSPFPIPAFGALWCLCGNLVQPWLKLKPVSVDLHMFGVLLFDSRNFCCLLLCFTTCSPQWSDFNPSLKLGRMLVHRQAHACVGRIR